MKPEHFTDISSEDSSMLQYPIEQTLLFGEVTCNLRKFSVTFFLGHLGPNGFIVAPSNDRLPTEFNICLKTTFKHEGILENSIVTL